MLKVAIVLFWLCLALVFYTYLGYGLLLFIIIKIKRIIKGKKMPANPEATPSVSVIIAAYNEEDFIEQKLENTLELDYPSDKIEYIFVSDGSTDKTPQIISKFPGVILMHENDRKGKNAAVERVLPFAKYDILVFTDANTLLNKDAIKKIVRHYEDKKVGAVAGEKKIMAREADSASGAGEGIYWKYESKLKTWDSELYSVVGAAGELFSVRKELYEKVPKKIIIEDFYLTLKVAQNGYRVIYEPEAFAREEPSASVGEELKRKIRIAAGGIQAVIKLYPLLNFFKYGVLSFQYISHRVLRWTVTPAALPVLFFINLYLTFQELWLYQVIFILQCAFYSMAIIGLLLERKHIKLKVFFVPFYFSMMNYAVFAGFVRILKGKQSVLWEKSKRRD